MAQSPLVQAEWAALQQIRAIGKSTKMKQVVAGSGEMPGGRWWKVLRIVEQ